MLAPWKKNYDQPREHIRKQTHYFADKHLSSQGYGFSSSQVWIWELVHKEGWAQKNWCFQTVLLEETLESPLDCKEIQPVSPKGNQSQIFIGRTDAKAENSYTLATWCEELTLWKRPWCWERLKAGREGEDTGWDGCKASLTEWTWVEQTQSWWWTGKPELDMTAQLNWTELALLGFCIYAVFNNLLYFKPLFSYKY